MKMTCSLSLHQSSSLIVYVCHPHSVLHAHWAWRMFNGPGISCGARKLVRTLRVKKKVKLKGIRGKMLHDHLAVLSE